MAAISNLYIYREPRCPAIDFEEIADYAESLSGAKVCLRGPLIEESIDGRGPLGISVPPESLARLLAIAKVKKLDAPPSHIRPVLPGELDYEVRRLADRGNGVFGILYDAHFVAGLLARLLPEDESRIDRLHIVFTNQLLGTWDEGDRRYHARSVLLGAPSIISLSGMVEAPAKAPGYYLARRSAGAFGVSEDEKMELARTFAEDCLSHDDVRLTEAAKGYVMQAVAYRITGVPFCGDPDCRLFNAHWQRELINAQLGGAFEFCGEHRRIFDEGADKDGEPF